MKGCDQKKKWISFPQCSQIYLSIPLCDHSTQFICFLFHLEACVIAQFQTHLLYTKQKQKNKMKKFTIHFLFVSVSPFSFNVIGQRIHYHTSASLCFKTRRVSLGFFSLSLKTRRASLDFRTRRARIRDYSGMSELLEAIIPFLGETFSGGQGAQPQGPDSLPLPSQEALPPGPNSPTLEVGAGEPSSIKPNDSLEASMRARILKLERANSYFLLDKRNGEYWNEIRMALRNCSSQKEYTRLLDFEHRDLRIRETQFECFTLFQGVLSQHPALRKDAAYDPTESFMDFFSEKRDTMNQEYPELNPAEKDWNEIFFIEQVKNDLRTRGHESSYILKLLGYGEGGPSNSGSEIPRVAGDEAGPSHQGRDEAGSDQPAGSDSPRSLTLSDQSLLREILGGDTDPGEEVGPSSRRRPLS